MSEALKCPWCGLNMVSEGHEPTCVYLKYRDEIKQDMIKYSNDLAILRALYEYMTVTGINKMPGKVRNDDSQKATDSE